MLDFRMYEPGDRDGCLDLVRTGHDADFTGERFDWLHREGPWGPTQVALAVSEGRIVGMYSVLPKAVFLDGKTYRGARDVDPVVHPDFRGQGLFSRLLTFGLENFTDLDFLFNFANPASAAGFRKFGWRDCAPLEDRVRQLGFPGSLSPAALLWFMGLMTSPGATGASTRMLDEAEFATFLDAHAEALETPVTSDRAGVHRTAAYFRWRYLDHPLYRYSYFVAEKPSGPTGLAVCRHKPESGQVVVLDVAGLGARPALGDWLDDWRASYGKTRIVAWHSLPGATLQGFLGHPLKKGQGQTFLVRELPGGNAPPTVFDSQGWCLTRGDLEIS